MLSQQPLAKLRCFVGRKKKCNKQRRGVTGLLRTGAVHASQLYTIKSKKGFLLGLGHFCLLDAKGNAVSTTSSYFLLPLNMDVKSEAFQAITREGPKGL